MEFLLTMIALAAWLVFGMFIIMAIQSGTDDGTEKPCKASYSVVTPGYGPSQG